MEERRKEIAGSTLKIIAMISMLIDHIGASLLRNYILINSSELKSEGVYSIYVTVYYIVRGIGRLAFPVYIFLLLEGFKHTGNRLRYLGRLVAFALISEMPFDWAFNLGSEEIKSGKIIEFSSQNVFFTLAIGLMAIILIDYFSGLEIDPMMKAPFWILITVISGFMAYGMKTDYDMWGVFAIIAGYIMLKQPVMCMTMIIIVLGISNLYELVDAIDIAIVCFYNGKRGMKQKWMFYLFYPAHLMILGIVCFILF